MVSHSTTSAFLLAALFVSVYGLPADTTLVSAPTTVGGAAYPAAPATVAALVDHQGGDNGSYTGGSRDGVNGFDDRAPRRRGSLDGVNGYDDRAPRRRGSLDGVNGYDDRAPRRRGRSPSRRHGDDSDDCRSGNSSRHSSLGSRHSSRSSRSVSCASSDSGRSRSRSSSCDRSASSDYSSNGEDVENDHRHRRRHRRCVRHPHHPHHHHFGPPGFWHPHPWGPPRPWGRYPWDEFRPVGPHHPWRPIHHHHHRPLPYGPHPHGVHNDSEGSDCDSSAASPLERRFFDDRSDVDRVTGLPRIYFGGRGGGYPADRGDYDEEDEEDEGAYGGGADDYDEMRGDYGNDDYGDYGGDDYRRASPSRNGGPARDPRGRGPIRRGGNHPTLNSDRKYSEHDYEANANQHSVDIADRRQGRLSLDQRHADEQSYDKDGRERVMVDRYGQRVTSRQEQIDAARRQADATDLHISGPRGSLDHSQRSASEDTFNSDSSERTFNGPNRRATERNYSVSTSSRDVSSESTRVVNRQPARRY